MKEILDDFERTNDPNLAPNRILFNSLINAWAQSGEQGAAQRAEALLQKMHTMATATNNSTLFPDVFSFSSVLHAWAKSKEPIAASRAEAILQRMYEIDKSGLIIDFQEFSNTKEAQALDKKVVWKSFPETLESFKIGFDKKL